MKRIGIIGGIGPESTIDYYRGLVSAYRQDTKDSSYPHIVINSIDLTRMLALVAEHRLEELARFLSAEVERLAAAGAAIGALAANTPHIVFDEVQERSQIPLISIVRATLDAAEAHGLKRLALLGTRFTMAGTFYHRVFAPRGVVLIAPGPEEQSFVHDVYMNQLLKGHFLDDTREKVVSLLRLMKTREQIDGAILAGTELPLLLRDTSVNGVALLDTTQVHVRAILRAALS